VGFALVYVVAVEQNSMLFTYHPISNAMSAHTCPLMKCLSAMLPPIYKTVFLLQPTLRFAVKAAMYWFGWMATAALAGGVSALVACRLPVGLARLLHPALAWLAPLGVLLAFGYLLSSFFCADPARKTTASDHDQTFNA
jgi:hypothetical protein